MLTGQRITEELAAKASEASVTGARALSKTLTRFRSPEAWCAGRFSRLAGDGRRPSQPPRFSAVADDRTRRLLKSPAAPCSCGVPTPRSCTRMWSSGNRGWESRLQSFTGALLTIYWMPSSRICAMCGCCGCSMPSGWTASKGRPRIEAAISAFRARGGVVETEERNVGSASPRRWV